MLGNGFDLSYKLPTKYINFLNTVNYISSASLLSLNNVGAIFGAQELHHIDKDIAESYAAYQAAYDNTLIDAAAINTLTLLARNNLLYKFLSKSYNKDIGWIDFEKEVAAIITAFGEFLKKDNPVFNPKNHPESANHRFIIRHFGFFRVPTSQEHINPSFWKVKDEYIIEYPYGSDNKIINKAAIIHELEKQLQELAEGLRTYLICFVENVVWEMRRRNCLQQNPALMPADCVITFNYTSTYESLYDLTLFDLTHNVFHIHGCLNKRIILGINPDQSDELQTIDVSFLRFKKYFQRVLYRTDDKFLEWIASYKDFSLVVMGHSLDETDKDIITQVFDRAEDITILYYNESSEASQVTNLIHIYGKEKFDKLRRIKHLRFLPQDGKYTYFAEDRAKIEEEAENAKWGSFIL